jgi:putative GTP pyrophosphokinase
MTADKFSNSRADRLGEHLKSAVLTPAEIVEINDFRQSFAAAYAYVMAQLEPLETNVVGRPSKSTSSITAKLNRESVRLSQMQDIAGCRMVMPDALRQEEVFGRLSQLFPGSHVIDRRARPSHGYRAIHLVVHHNDRVVEVQIRTELQHLWAEFSEKLADRLGAEIKYGGGPELVRELLAKLSDLVEAFEVNQKTIAEVEGKIVAMRAREPLLVHSLEKRKLRDFKKDLLQGVKLAQEAKVASSSIRTQIIELFENSVSIVEALER